MEPTITLICGDDLETNVFASSYAGDLSILFRFSFDASQRRRINSRIVACFHDLEVDDAESSFADRAAMRLAIQSSISQAWQECASHPSVRLPDVVVQIQENEHGEVSWQIIHESSYREYVGGLMTIEHFRSTLIPESRRSQLELMPLGSLQLSDVLGGRGDTTLTQTSNGSDTRRTFVYKGLSFRPFLELGSGFHDEKETLYHEARSGILTPKSSKYNLPFLLPHHHKAPELRHNLIINRYKLHLWITIPLPRTAIISRSHREEQSEREGTLTDT